MANIFYAFWEKINKKLVPRNVKFNETSSNYIFTLQNANGSEESTRENLVSFAVPKQYGLSEKDKAKLDKVWDMDTQLDGFTSEQWQALVDASDAFESVNNDITTLKNQVDTLEGETDKTDSKNEASSSSAGYMSITDKTKLDNIITTTATQNNMGYMSATDKTALDTLKLYSQQYTLIHANGEIEQHTTSKKADTQYGFKFNTSTNSDIAEVDPDDLIRITIKQGGTYLILATGCIVPQLGPQDIRTANVFTMRVIHSRGEENNISLEDGEIVSGGTSIASANTPFTDNWFTSGTTFTVINLQANDKLALIAAHPITTPQIMYHQKCRIFLFKALSDIPDAS